MGVVVSFVAVMKNLMRAADHELVGGICTMVHAL